MTSLFILIIILTLIVLVMDYINKKKSNDFSTDESFDELVLNSFEVTNDTNTEQVMEPSIEVREELPSQDNTLVNEIRYVEDDEELEKTKAKLELENLKQELIKKEQVEDVPIYIESDEETKTDEEIKTEVSTQPEAVLIEPKSKIDEFEDDQEENAIISIDQFNKISDRVYDENELTQYKDEGNEPISIQELEELYHTKELSVIKEEPLVIEEEEIIDFAEEKLEMPSSFIEPSTKFKNSPIISPVFGIDTDEKINIIELENTANLGKLDEEIRKTNEFLNTLRELRKKLEP